MKKIEQEVPTTTVKIIDVFNKIVQGKLDPDPAYQRKLIWKKQHKYKFIETILLNYPFPEVYIASNEIDIDSLTTTERIVDGKQRLTTIVEYIKGVGDFEKQNKVTQFDDLNPSEKKSFLKYNVSVKDLKDVNEEQIVEIFTRINSTEYKLNSNEKQKSIYGDSDFLILANSLVAVEYKLDETLTDIRDTEAGDFSKSQNFFSENNVFSRNDIDRMFDSQFVMLVLASFFENNYFSRNSKIDHYLEEFNNEIPDYLNCVNSLRAAQDFITKMGLASDSYWFNKANLFTLLCELMKINTDTLCPEAAVNALLNLEAKQIAYFDEDKEIPITDNERKYFEFSRQGSHEGKAREHRGEVVSLLINKPASNSEVGDDNVELDESDNFKFVIIRPTETGISKSILDATTPVREFLFENNIHNFDQQDKGSGAKVVIDATWLQPDNKNDKASLSLYKSKSRGDCRMSLSGLSKNIEAKEPLALIWTKEGNLNAVNLARVPAGEIIGLLD